MSRDDKVLQDKIEALKESIDNTREEFLEKMHELKSELRQIREISNRSSDSQESHSILSTQKEEIKESFYKEPATTSDAVVEKPYNRESEQAVDKAVQVESKTNTHKESLHSQQTQAGVNLTDEVKRKEEAIEPGIISEFFSSIIHSVISYVLSSITIFSAPFQELFHKLIKLYSHYQKQGKAPVFLMTAAGIATLTVGFGYLLQYSFNTLFSDVLKAVTGFVIGAGIVAAGIVLSKKDTDFKDYGASVIALGVIFNYLTAYFVGPYYGIVGETSGFILLLVVTLASFSLALIFETRVVSAITLVGGVFMPFIVGDAESAGLVFLAYLFVLSVGNLYLSQKIKWPSLSQITFFLSLSVVEYIGISEVVHPFASFILLTLFFYAYTYYWSFNGVQLKEKLSKHDLTILVANAFYFIYAVLYVPADNYIIAGVLLVHALVLGFIVKTLRLMSSVIAPVYMLMIGLMIATAVFVLSPADVTSIIWAVEGLAMLYIGFKYTHKLIRAEGYAIYVIAMLGLLWQAIEAFTSMSSSGIAWHWINLIAFGVLSLIAYRIIYHYKEKATVFERNAAHIQNEIFTFWGAVALSLLVMLYAPRAMTVLAVIPMLWCFYRVSRHKLNFAQITGYILFFGFVIQIIIGMNEARSTVISEQSIITWLAIIELLFFSRLMRVYYQRYELSGWGRDIAFKLNNAFYFSPVVLIGLGLFNIFDAHVYGSKAVSFGYLWLDFVIAGGLIFIAYKSISKLESTDENLLGSQYSYIINETVSLFATVFFLYTMSILFGEWMYNLAVIPLFYLLYRSITQKLKITEKLAWLHFSLFGIMTLLSHQAVGNFHFSEQSLSTQIGWLELMVSAWFMQFMYERLDNKEGGGYRLSCYLRIGVYLLIPVLFLPRVLRLYENYLPVALWCSFAISWVMYKKIKIEPLLKELLLLFMLAVAGTAYMSLGALSGENQLPGLIALLTGVLIISAFHYVEKTLSNHEIADSPYHKLILVSPYYYGFSLAAFSYAVSHQVSIVVVMSGLYFLYLVQERKLFSVMRETLNISYALSWLCLLALPVLIFSQSIKQSMFITENLIAISANLISLAGLWYLTHQRIATLELLKRKYSDQNIQHWIFHCVLFVVYTGSINMIFTAWTVLTSIAILVHAVYVLFLTLKDRYKGLLRLSIILYAITAAKVLFHDMGDFGNLHKVIALMCIGSILMVAAFFFQKIKNRQLQ